MNYKFKYWHIIPAVLIIPILLYHLILLPSPVGFIKPNDTGAWLGYFGSVIGGAITLAGVRLTLQKQQDNRVEDLRMRVLPFLTFRTEVNSRPPYEISVHSHISKRDNSDATALRMLRGKIVVRNSGIGIAVFPSIIETTYMGETSRGYDQESTFSLTPNDTASIQPDIYYVMPQKPDLTFTIGYFDIVGNYYTQVISAEGKTAPWVDFVDISPNQIQYQGLEIVYVGVPQLSKPPKKSPLNVGMKSESVPS